MDARQAADLLNQMLTRAPRATRALLTFRVPCDEGTPGSELRGDRHLLSVLALVNAVIDDKVDHVVEVLDDRKRLAQFGVLPRDFG